MIISKKKHKLEFNLIPEKNLVIPEYKIDLLNKNKKIINKIENIEKIENNNFKSANKRDFMKKFNNYNKFNKKPRFKGKFKYRKRTKNNFFENKKTANY